MKLDELQLAIMRALWRLGTASVTQVRDELATQDGRDLAPTTVGTVLARLEKKGVVAHATEGRQYIYRPLVSENATGRSQLTALINNFFGGSSASLVNHLLSEREFDATELADLKRLLDEAKKS
ncbi:MAG: BlaI/MecI/CopY family transcriptional regulator [Bernardetiaceae bacterium]|jgi:predicted transcriptional regulator|nr:BlaI/MecI/CopY family transcriptional regulator [Bernardetiaceae bacterium]